MSHASVYSLNLLFFLTVALVVFILLLTCLISSEISNSFLCDLTSTFSSEMCHRCLNLPNLICACYILDFDVYSYRPYNTVTLPYERVIWATKKM